MHSSVRFKYCRKMIDCDVLFDKAKAKNKKGKQTQRNEQKKSSV